MGMDFRYKKLGYVALNVTDMEKSAVFYRDMVGLDPAGDGPDGCKFFRCSNDHHNIILYTGQTGGLKRIGWQMETDASLDSAFEHFTEIGLKPKWIESGEQLALKQGRTFRMTEPHTGSTFEYYADISQFIPPFSKKVTKIARLGHVVMTVADFAKTRQHLTEQLNFRVSDFIPGMFAFMRCFPNPFHHSLAVGQGTENRLNHVNFMVTDIDDVGKGNIRAQKMQVPIVFGPGRHPPSDSIFLYFLDPDEMTIEFSFGMEEFPEVNPRAPRMLEPSLETLDYWGGAPSPRFGAKGVIETVG
jgi:2,3-dihydroxy-p-cumate/2,3-dihydroxybenzoate 3,4-dioxygenase